MILLLACVEIIPPEIRLNPDHDWDADGMTENGGDCNDDDQTVFRGAPELCDALDNDCDGDTDEDAVDALSWYADGDSDDYGSDESELLGCEAPGDGWVTLGGDCEDSNAGIYPGQAEACDGIDSDCDGVDGGEAAEGAVEFYRDADADGFGDADRTTAACDAPDGYVDDDQDCDDSDAAVHPDQIETCATVGDDDCDGDANDVDAHDCIDFWEDADQDGYGTGEAVCTCWPEDDFWATVGGDCDDENGDVHPYAEEGQDDPDYLDCEVDLPSNCTWSADYMICADLGIDHDTSRSACQDLGLDLAILTSGTEVLAVSSAATALGNLRDVHVCYCQDGGVWQWCDGSTAFDPYAEYGSKDSSAGDPCTVIRDEIGSDNSQENVVNDVERSAGAYGYVCR